MKKEVLLKVNLESGKEYNFISKLHKSEKKESLKINPDFYKKYGLGIPIGTHYEIEWELAPLLSKDFSDSLLHIHHENDHPFVCWTQQTKTEEKAIEIFKLVSLGTLYTFQTYEDFARILTKNEKSIEKTIVDFNSILGVKSIEIEIGYDKETKIEIKNKKQILLSSGKYNCFRKTICY